MGDTLWYGDACKLMETAEYCASRGDWRGAYRNHGQAVEFLLKAIYLRNHQMRDMPAHLRTASSHDLKSLAASAGINQQIVMLRGVLRANWLTVRDWDHGRRYPNEPFPSKDGKELRRALCNPSNGVWQWLLSIYLTN